MGGKVSTMTSGELRVGMVVCDDSFSAMIE